MVKIIRYKFTFEFTIHPFFVNDYKLRKKLNKIKTYFFSNKIKQ